MVEVLKAPQVPQDFLALLEELDPQGLLEPLVQPDLLVNQAKKVLLVFVEILVLTVVWEIEVPQDHLAVLETKETQGKMDNMVNLGRQGRWAQQALWAPVVWREKEDGLDPKVLQGAEVLMACQGSRGQWVHLG